APSEFVELICTLLDFSYIAHAAELTEDDLDAMDRVLAVFHKVKYVLVRESMVPWEKSFDQIAKLHMLGHYTNDIRELGTPDSYSTEVPEQLHIVYVKIPWCASNQRNPLPQMVNYVQRLEAIQTQRTYIDEYYGKWPGAKDKEITLLGDDEDEAKSKARAGNISRVESNKDSDEETIEVESETSAELDKMDIHYPRPSRLIAKQPTIPHLSRRALITSYSASNLIQATYCFLSSKVSPCAENVLVLPSDHFNVWHKVVLNHPPLPFAPCELNHRVVIHVHPTI
ncbi:hypothetical protein FRC06_006411, partial [Ceratobasidium sp. 370]